ncbi:MAG: class I SAM-dependent methyltransferase [Vulcanimicrobiota bacterium]
MKASYLRYYQKHSPLAAMVFLWDSLFLKSKVARLSLANRQQDYVALADQPDLLKLHHDLHQMVLEASQQWGSYDYGEGYFYQSSPELGIRGLRDTRARLEGMELKRWLAGKSVLEIGCNSGFLGLAVAAFASHLTGFDINPHLVAMANRAAQYLGRQNATFTASSFEDFDCSQRFEAVLSFANHSTYDQNTRQSIEQYLDRCVGLLEPEGLFLFESHPPELEGESLAHVLELIGERFEVLETRVLKAGSFMDKERTYLVGRRKSGES